MESLDAACFKMVSLVEKTQYVKKKVQVNFQTLLALTPFNVLNITLYLSEYQPQIIFPE